MNKMKWQKTIRQHHRACRRNMIAAIRKNDGSFMYCRAREANPFSVDMYLPWKCGKDMI